MSKQRATLGGGCFWCTEAAFKEVPGVKKVVPGYAGGHVEDPTYEQVCTGNTGHAEVIQITYNGDEIAYADLLQVFFTIHDPTQLNRQGPDVGTQYRSVILAHDQEQLERAKRFIDQLNERDAYDDEIVTEVELLDEFYRAEEKHHDYFEKNPNDRYCSIHAEPKVRKVREAFSEGAEQSASN
ncbi:MAG: peptide-methionine (S)-S-oxide reductase MsrA [Halobacteriaceae archaeon]